jgi:hypothetical protein
MIVPGWRQNTKVGRGLGLAAKADAPPWRGRVRSVRGGKGADVKKSVPPPRPMCRNNGQRPSLGANGKTGLRHVRTSGRGQVAGCAGFCPGRQAPGSVLV